MSKQEESGKQEDTWWNHQGAQVTKPTVMLVAPRRGDFAGPCARKDCGNTGADWYNRATYAYYCRDCAELINERCRASGMRAPCELHG
jgi:hypothetical protein